VLKGEIGSDYPVMEQTRLFKGDVKIEGKQVSQTTVDKGMHGLIFRSQEKAQIAQFRRDGFTFNKLHPYTSWEKVFAEAWRLWELYTSCSSPESVSRVAVRYVNHINIPLPGDISHYITDPPTIPENVPRKMSNYFKRIVVRDEDAKLSANIIQALEPRASDRLVVFLLDIDVYSERDYEPGFDKLEDVFESLRVLKNQIFFNYVTEKTMGMCQ
jgi:uncharacterized protein (TIGR04255 family)